MSLTLSSNTVKCVREILALFPWLRGLVDCKMYCRFKNSIDGSREEPCFEKVVACLGVKALIWLSLLMYGMASKDTHNKGRGE